MNKRNKDFELPFTFDLTSFEDLSDTKLPTIEEFNRWKNYKNRKITIDFDIGDFLLNFNDYIRLWNEEDKNIEIKDRNPIYIYIYSYGGSLDNTTSFIDMLKLSKTPIKLINIGQACSAAALIFMAKSENIERIMLPTSRVLIHQGQVQLGGQTNSVLDMTEDIKRSEEKIKKYVLNNTTINPKLYDKKKRVEWSLDAEQALKFGVCDKILEDIDELY